MSSGKVQNPSGFRLYRVAKSKTRRVSRYVEWQSPKPAGFLVHPCRGVLHTPPNVPRQRFGSKIGQVLGGHVCGNMKPAKFCTYPCRGVLHTPRNAPRRRFAPKIGRVLGVSGWGNVEPGWFCTYPCRGVLHTPPNVLRQGFGYKIGQNLGLSLLGRVKSGRFLAYPYWENVKPDRFFMYPCRGVLHTPRNVLRQGFGSKIGCVFGEYVCGNMKPTGCVFGCIRVGKYETRQILHVPV